MADVLVAEARGIVGYVKLAPGDATTARITGLAVDRHARGRGIGLHLITSAIEEAVDRGYSSMVLHVLGTNAAALRVYREAGFSVAERSVGRFMIDGCQVDDLTMLKRF